MAAVLIRCYYRLSRPVREVTPLYCSYMKVFFEKREELAPAIWQYYFRPERTPDFVAGQYVDLQLKNVTDDPRGATRTFTLTSLPSDPSISFVLKHFELQSPYKHVLQTLEPGTGASIGDAMGDLVLPKSSDLPLVFIAGGIGIASFISMLDLLIQQREQRSIYFFYALRSRREQIFRQATEGYPLELKQLIFAPNELSAQEVVDSTPPDALVYISGSQKFVETMRTGLEALGTHRSNTVFDYYDGYAEL